MGFVRVTYFSLGVDFAAALGFGFGLVVVALGFVGLFAVAVSFGLIAVSAKNFTLL